MRLNTYLNYGGNCAEAFKFYEEHLGGKVGMVMKHGDMPDPSKVVPEMKDLVLHATITIGHPRGHHGPVRRRPLREFVYEDRWDGEASWVADPPGTEFTAAGPPGTWSGRDDRRAVCWRLTVGCRSSWRVNCNWIGPLSRSQPG